MAGQKKSPSKSNLEENINSLTMHGVSRIFSSKNKVSKFLWAAIFITSFCTGIYFISVLISDYSDHKTFTKISQTFVPTMPFPAITICNSYTYAEIVEMSEPEVGKKKERFPNLIRELTLDNMKSNCIFGFNRHCHLQDSFSLHPSSIACVIFNPNGSFVQKIANENFGLKLYLFVNESNISDFDMAMRNPGGTLISVHSPKAKQLLTGDELQLPTGFHSKLSLKTKRIHRLPDPFSNCTNTIIGTSMEGLNIPYTVKHCLMACYNMKIYEHCGTMLKNVRDIFTVEKFPARRNMTADELSNCTIKTTNWFGSGTNRCNCPSPCHEIIYSHTLSLTRWPLTSEVDRFARQFENALNRNVSIMTRDYISRNFLSLSIYFDEFVYDEIIEEEAYSVYKLISDIGGHIGLYLGASSISIIEIFWLITKHIPLPKRLEIASYDSPKDTVQ